MARPKEIVRRLDKVMVVYNTEEFEKLRMLFARSTARTIGGYIRKVSLEQPVQIVTRNGSFDSFVDEIAILRKEMKILYEQGNWSSEDRGRLIRLHEEIRLLINKIAELCMRQ